MNYLAHAYLSFGDSEILTGNLISDFVKGKKKYDYPPQILAGINLHRDIDAFTDDHAVNKEVGKMFKPVYGLYSSAITDVIYDHFLALELCENGIEKFEDYTQEVYQKIEKHRDILPENFKYIFPFMKEHNWLFNYQFTWGIEKSMSGLVHRATYMYESDTAFKLFTDRYEELKNAYQEFFPQLREFSLKKFSDIH